MVAPRKMEEHAEPQPTTGEPCNNPNPDRSDEFQAALAFQKDLVENLKEVIQARDLEIKYLENTIKIKDILLQNYPDDRAFNALYRIYQKGNRLLPVGTWRRKLAARMASFFIR